MTPNTRPILLCLACCIMPGIQSASAAVTLVENGQARAVIVLADAPSPAAELGSRILRDHLRQISGAELKIMKESAAAAPTAEKPWILIGQAKLAAEMNLSAQGLGAGGVLLGAKQNVVALMGTDARTPVDPDGSRYAVTVFLEEKLGVRWLWPGELGKVLPRRRTIVIDDFEWSFTPRIAERRIRSGHYNDRLQVGLNNLRFTREDYQRLHAAGAKSESESGSWLAWHRLGGSLGVPAGHAFGSLWEKHGKQHRDWFALQPDGTRDQSRSPSRPRLCKSNLELIDEIARLKIEELKQNPALRGVSICLNDGSANSFCTCPKCEALDVPGARTIKLWKYGPGGRTEIDHVSLTDRHVWFWNAIAQRVCKVHPDKLLSVYAYSIYSAPPVERKLHPNLVVKFVPMTYLDDNARKQSLKDFEAWSQMAGKIFFRPNLLLAGSRNGMPLVYAHRFAEDFRWLSRQKMVGTDFDSCSHNWATQGLNYYVAARLHWDPDQDIDALITDYCRAGFGPAERSVRAYFDQLEALTLKVAQGRDDLDEAGESRKIVNLAPFTPEAINALRDLLAAAKREAANDATIRQRIELLEVGLRWTDVESRVHALYTAHAKGQNVKAAAQKVLDERYALMREIFAQHHLAVNVASISWGEDGLWGRLGWKRPINP